MSAPLPTSLPVPAATAAPAPAPTAPPVTVPQPVAATAHSDSARTCVLMLRFICRPPCLRLEADVRGFSASGMPPSGALADGRRLVRPAETRPGARRPPRSGDADADESRRGCD